MAMTPVSHSAPNPCLRRRRSGEPLELTPRAESRSSPTFDERPLGGEPGRSRGAGGRKVLGVALTVLAAAVDRLHRLVGRPGAGRPVAVVAADRAMDGDRRRAAGAARARLADLRPHPAQGSGALHPFGGRNAARSAIARGACSRCCRSGSSTAAAELTMISQHLMQLGDEATGKLGGITREFDGSTEKLTRHGEALDRAALTARNDIAVLLEDLPRAEQTARRLAEQLRAVGSESGNARCELGQQVNDLAERTGEADRLIGEADRPAGGAAGRDRSAGATAAARRSARPRPASRARSTPCSNAPRRRSRKSAPASTPRRRRSRRWSSQASAGIGKAGAEAPKRSPPTSITPTTLARRPVGARRRAGARVATHDRGDRPRTGADRRALPRTRDAGR